MIATFFLFEPRHSSNDQESLSLLRFAFSDKKRIVT